MKKIINACKNNHYPNLVLFERTGGTLVELNRTPVKTLVKMMVKTPVKIPGAILPKPYFKRSRPQDRTGFSVGRAGTMHSQPEAGNEGGAVSRSINKASPGGAR
ncbi:hypothetical protein GF406_07015 [candidate division KSB1 bacterium]|nr:hypothetical protein [candidate division KSB1 bacterium]